MVEKDLREAAFQGRITAAFTHDMKNVLAIIKESAGLIEDLFMMSRDAPFPQRERVMRCIATIQDQTKRGVELSNRLNRFAHSTDEEMAQVDLNDLLEQVIVLSGRFARLKGVTMTLVPHEEVLSVFVPPITLQMAVFACLECCWGNLATGGKVALSVSKERKEAMVRFVCQNESEGSASPELPLSDATESEGIQSLMAKLHGKIGCCADQSGLELILPIVT